MRVWRDTPLRGAHPAARIGGVFDNIRLRVVPESRTWMLYALGMVGCVVLLRRRAE